MGGKGLKRGTKKKMGEKEKKWGKKKKMAKKKKNGGKRRKKLNSNFGFHIGYSVCHPKRTSGEYLADIR